MPYNTLDTVKQHFTVGNVILSDYWQQYDLVLDFKITDEGAWKGCWIVTVQDCDKFGNATRGQQVRMHSTYPDPKDKIICNVLHYTPCITFDRVIHSV